MKKLFPTIQASESTFLGGEAVTVTPQVYEPKLRPVEHCEDDIVFVKRADRKLIVAAMLVAGAFGVLALSWLNGVGFGKGIALGLAILAATISFLPDRRR